MRVDHLKNALKSFTHVKINDFASFNALVAITMLHVAAELR